MTKKNRKKKDSQGVENGVVGASENPIEAQQPGQMVDGGAAQGSENLIEQNQAQPLEEPVNVDLDPEDESVTNPQGEHVDEDIHESAASEETDSPEDDLMDDLLADVRSSLIEDDETVKGEKKSSWWNRLVKGPSEPETPVVETPATLEESVPVESIQPTFKAETQDSDESVEEIDELIKLLETDELEDQDEPLVVSTPVSLPVEEEVKVDIDELKKQAFTHRSEEEAVEELGDVRKIALDGNEEVFVEVEVRKEDPWEERLKSVENALRPYRTYVNYGLAFIGVIMAVMASVLIYNGVKQSLPTPEPTASVNMPYPTTVTLPGGLNFGLGKGALKDGTWDPRGPEWLEGTEICRWVALPWSRPLEAAVRTMNRDDVIELVMSNNDKLSYQVESIQELTPAELQEMDSSTPCLAIILARQDSEKRWVAVGRP
jgi:hypothetical protein